MYIICKRRPYIENGQSDQLYPIYMNDEHAYNDNINYNIANTYTIKNEYRGRCDLQCVPGSHYYFADVSLTYEIRSYPREKKRVFVVRQKLLYSNNLNWQVMAVWEYNTCR